MTFGLGNRCSIRLSYEGLDDVPGFLQRLTSILAVMDSVAVGIGTCNEGHAPEKIVR